MTKGQVVSIIFVAFETKSVMSVSEFLILKIINYYDAVSINIEYFHYTGCCQQLSNSMYRYIRET